MLRRVVDQRVNRRGRALDLGCGAGTYSLFLAQQGYEVTGVDPRPAAIRAAREAAQRQGASARFIEADVLAFKAEGTFELIFDSGCLQRLKPRERAAYRRNLMGWLGTAADYLLVHLAKRHPLDWWPVGPRRRSRAQIVSEFEPALFLRVYSEELQATSAAAGRTQRVTEYWFQHSR
jgi:SAM-dependent methyltransferase